MQFFLPVKALTYGDTTRVRPGEPDGRAGLIGESCHADPGEHLNIRNMLMRSTCFMLDTIYA